MIKLFIPLKFTDFIRKKKLFFLPKSVLTLINIGPFSYLYAFLLQKLPTTGTCRHWVHLPYIRLIFSLKIFCKFFLGSKCTNSYVANCILKKKKKKRKKQIWYVIFLSKSHGAYSCACVKGSICSRQFP